MLERHPNKKLLLLTDEPHRSSDFETIFRDAIPMRELIFEHVQRGYVHAQYLLGLVSIFSKASVLVCTSGNVSFWISLYRNNGNEIYQYLSAKKEIYSVVNPNFDPQQKQFWLK